MSTIITLYLSSTSGHGLFVHESFHQLWDPFQGCSSTFKREHPQHPTSLLCRYSLLEVVWNVACHLESLLNLY